MPLVRLPRRFRLIGALTVTQIIGWSSSFEMPAVLGPKMGEEIGLPVSLVFAGLTVMMVTGGLVGPSVGRMLARHGGARVLACGSVLFSLALVLLSISHGLTLYAIAWLVMGLGGACALSTPAYAAVVEREGASGKRIISLLMIFTGLSATIFWPINAYLLDTLGWRLTLLVLAALNVAVCLPLHLFGLPERIAEAGVASVEDTPPLKLTAPQKRLAFLLVAVTSTVTAFVSFGLSPTLLELLRQSGASPAFALQLGSARGAIGISARAVDFLFGKRGNPILTALAGCGLMGLACPVLLFLPSSTATLVLFMAFYGLGSGVMAVARAVLPLAVFSPREFGLQSARISLPQNLAIAIAPVIFAALMEHLGAASALVVAGLLMSVCFGLVLMLGALARRALPPPSAPAPASATITP